MAMRAASLDGHEIPRRTSKYTLVRYGIRCDSRDDDDNDGEDTNVEQPRRSDVLRITHNNRAD